MSHPQSSNNAVPPTLVVGGMSAELLVAAPENTNVSTAADHSTTTTAPAVPIPTITSTTTTSVHRRASTHSAVSSDSDSGSSDGGKGAAASVASATDNASVYSGTTGGGTAASRSVAPRVPGSISSNSHSHSHSHSNGSRSHKGRSGSSSSSLSSAESSRAYTSQSRPPTLRSRISGGSIKVTHRSASSMTNTNASVHSRVSRGRVTASSASTHTMSSYSRPASNVSATNNMSSALQSGGIASRRARGGTVTVSTTSHPGSLTGTSGTSGSHTSKSTHTSSFTSTKSRSYSSSSSSLSVTDHTTRTSATSHPTDLSGGFQHHRRDDDSDNDNGGGGGDDDARADAPVRIDDEPMAFETNPAVAAFLSISEGMAAGTLEAARDLPSLNRRLRHKLRREALKKELRDKRLRSELPLPSSRGSASSGSSVTGTSLSSAGSASQQTNSTATTVSVASATPSAAAAAPPIASTTKTRERSMARRKRRAEKTSLSAPMLRRFCTEFSVPLTFETAGILPQRQAAVEKDPNTDVPLNTHNGANAVLMQTVAAAVAYVESYGPQHPAELVRALLWRVEQASSGPHERLGAWKLVDSVLRFLRHRLAGYMAHRRTLEQAERVAAAAATQLMTLTDTTEGASLEAKQKALAAEITALDASHAWVKDMLAQLAQLLPYVILYCWGGERDRSAAVGFRGKAGSRYRRMVSQRTGIDAVVGASEQPQLPHDASAQVQGAADNIRRRVTDFVAGRVFGDGSLTERGSKTHSSMLRHHRNLDTNRSAAAEMAAAVDEAARYSRKARNTVGNAVHLSESHALAIPTENEVRAAMRQIHDEYQAMLRTWRLLFSTDVFYVSFAKLRRAVADYASLLTEREHTLARQPGGPTAPQDGAASESSNLYQYSKSGGSKGGAAGAAGGSVRSMLDRQREVFEEYLIPPHTFVDALWKLRRRAPRPSLVFGLLASLGVDLFAISFKKQKGGGKGFGGDGEDEAALLASSAPADSLPYISGKQPPRPTTHVVSGITAELTAAHNGVGSLVFPATVEEIEAALPHRLNRRAREWVTKAVECRGGCLACDSWDHTHAQCPYQPSHFLPRHRRQLAALSGDDAFAVLRRVQFKNKSAAIAAAAQLTTGRKDGPGTQPTQDEASATAAGATATPANDAEAAAGQSRRVMIMEVLDAAVERARQGAEIDPMLDALDVALRQSSTGLERQAIQLLSSYRLEPSRMLRFTDAATAHLFRGRALEGGSSSHHRRNPRADAGSSDDRRAMIGGKRGRSSSGADLGPFGGGSSMTLDVMASAAAMGRTPAADRAIAFLRREHRYFEADRVQAALSVLYFRYCCIPQRDPLLLRRLQEDIHAVRSTYTFLPALFDASIPAAIRAAAIGQDNARLEAAVSRLRHIYHLLDPATLEFSACCGGAAAEAAAEHAAALSAQPSALMAAAGLQRDAATATTREPWDWSIARHLLASVELIDTFDPNTIGGNNTTTNINNAAATASKAQQLMSRYHHPSDLLDRMLREAREAFHYGNAKRPANEGRAMGPDGVSTAARLLVAAHVLQTCDFCVHCNRLGHVKSNCRVLLATLLNTTLSAAIRNQLGIATNTDARLFAASKVTNEVRRLQATRHRMTGNDSVRDLHALNDILGILGVTGAVGGNNAASGRGIQHTSRGPAPMRAQVVLTCRMMGGMRPCLVDVGSTTHLSVVPFSFGEAVDAIVTHTGLSLSEVRYCPDECLALFHRGGMHHLTQHLAAFRAATFPDVVLSTGDFEDDLLEARAAVDRAHRAGTPAARTWALRPDEAVAIAMFYDGASLRSAAGALTLGAQRAVLAQQALPDRHLDLAAHLTRTTGTGASTATATAGGADYETVHTLLFPSTSRSRAARQQILRRGTRLRADLERLLLQRLAQVPTSNAAASLTGTAPTQVSDAPRIVAAALEAEREFYMHTLSAEADRAAYTLAAIEAAVGLMRMRIRALAHTTGTPAHEVAALHNNGHTVVHFATRRIAPPTAASALSATGSSFLMAGTGSQASPMRPSMGGGASASSVALLPGSPYNGGHGEVLTSGGSFLVGTSAPSATQLLSSLRLSTGPQKPALPPPTPSVTSTTSNAAAAAVEAPAVVSEQDLIDALIFGEEVSTTAADPEDTTTNHSNGSREISVSA